MSSFVQKKWADICTLEYGKGIRDYKNEDNDYSVYGSAGRVGTHSEFHLDKGVIVSRKGTLDVHYSDKPFFVIDTAFFLKPKPELNAKWAYYALKNFDIKKLTSGSGVPSLSRDEFYAEDLFLPSLEYQNEVESILSNIDKKIELNQKMNETLEEIAKTLFKSCFIDFDPVRAKAEGRPTGLSKEISDLFPDSFEDSELGEITSGWRVGCLQNIIECFDSKRIPLSKKSRQERVGIYPYYGATSIIDYVDDYLFDDELVLIGEDGSVERDDGTPFVQFINEKCWVNNHAHVLKAKDQFSNFHIYIFLNQVKIGPYVTGAVQKKINQTNLFSIPVIIPDEKILRAFNSITDPLKDKIFLNSKESDVLSSIRDTLLPKLISGELKISDAENFIHGAGV
jgi:type I restriction enzyme S subunit